MGCDIHIVIQRLDPADQTWREVPYQPAPYENIGQKAVNGFPIAPEVFRNRNYDLFGILANVRNGSGFAGVLTGDGWPSLAPDRGLPDGLDPATVGINPQYPEDGPRWLGDHSFTWITLDELKAFPWDSTVTTLYGVVPAKDYERLSALNEAPTTYCGDVSGGGIAVYEPQTYRSLKHQKRLAPEPYVRMSWPESARSATNDWPGQVIPWLETLAEGQPLRLILGFDS